ncbi:glycoside hydrolase family 2 protein [Kineococcus auxinigenes]|uniref:glycoside hydrolase family 2 protein n=1 Tax=unclassified Kineococcus TaxID=2621656 RepID=UPI003D7D6E1D
MRERELTTGWTLHPVGGDLPGPVSRALADGPLPVTVPGTVHTHLLDAGLIPDPYLGENETALAWLHRSAWEYRLDLAAAGEAAPAEGERVDLVFTGLDTVATITLDGVELGRTANMHRTFRFDVTGVLRAGGGDLRVRFDSALEHAEAVEKEVGSRPRAYDHPFNAVRKMACSFGWDWGPDLQTAGIWRPAGVQRWRTARLAAVRPLATLEGTTGRLAVHVDVERCGLREPGDLIVQVELPGLGAAGVAHLGPAQASALVELEVPDAPVWWPVGYGEQPLVDVVVRLSAGGAELGSLRLRTAFRTVELDTTPDEHGSRFTLVVNGQPVFARGANWIPEDHLLTRVTRERCAAALDRALEAHVNLVRVWGGGVYESDDFYDLADARGLMVWQDFPLACAAYSEEEPLYSEFVAEARENVTRLCPHPSLVLWNGGNENIWGHEDWGWKEQLGESTWGLGYYEGVFPAVLAELDPTRPYSPGSPANPGVPAGELHPNDPGHGTTHVWDVWNQRDYTAYRERVPRFCSEFGFQAPPTWATLTRALEPADLRKDSPAFALHQKAVDGNGKLDRGMAPHLGVPTGFRDWNWAAQLNQARAVRVGVEHLRSWWPRTAGSVYWQLNDCWPVTSWAVVDGDGRRKPAFHALRRAHAPRLATFQPRDGVVHLVLVNDTALAWRGRAHVRRTALGGRELAAASLEVDVPARQVRTLALPADLLAPADASAEVLVADVAGPSGGADAAGGAGATAARAVHAFAEDRDLAYEPEPLRTVVEEVPGGYAVRVLATSLARDVTLLADVVAPDAVVDDGLVTLLAGEVHAFTVRTGRRVPQERWTAPEVLRSANCLAAVERR